MKTTGIKTTAKCVVCEVRYAWTNPGTKRVRQTIYCPNCGELLQQTNSRSPYKVVRVTLAEIYRARPADFGDRKELPEPTPAPAPPPQSAGELSDADVKRIATATATAIVNAAQLALLSWRKGR